MKRRTRENTISFSDPTTLNVLIGMASGCGIVSGCGCSGKPFTIQRRLETIYQSCPELLALSKQSSVGDGR